MASPLLSYYPPHLPEERLEALLDVIHDWQLTHGSLIKSLDLDSSGVTAYAIGVSMFPTLFPRKLFQEGLDLQKSYNKLYCRVSADLSWLEEVLRNLIHHDPFAKALWSVHQKAKEAGCIQPLSLGIFRSDYMLHTSQDTQLSLKQVEFNTFSCAGGTHGNIVNKMHHHLVRTGAYTTSNVQGNHITSTSLPRTNTIEAIVSALADAHARYGLPKSAIASQTAVLMVVQPNNINICDERPIEYRLWDQDSAVPTYRVEFSGEVLTRTSLTEQRELLFYPPHTTVPLEVSVVYMRAGYDAEEHDAAGIEARIRIETSRAIKCPTVLAQLATFKKVQQALAIPGAVERFLSPDEAARMRATFAPIYPLDESELGQRARKLARDPQTAASYVLKPSLEGGGHNFYRYDIPAFLSRTPESEWRNYVLMELIQPPKLSNTLLSSRGVYEGGVVSELGVFGTVLWRSGREVGEDMEIMMNEQAGWSFKTKAEEVDEMSVVKGYGCFDTPCLVDFERKETATSGAHTRS